MSEGRALTRRRFLVGAGGLALAGVAAGIAVDTQKSSGSAEPLVPLPAQPAGLPARQHAWDAYLVPDRFGNPTPPRFNRLLMFDVAGKPTPVYARLLEATLRQLERAHAWGPNGLLFTAGWGTHYFRDVLRTASPIPVATSLSEFEQPSIDSYHLCLHLACDDELRLQAVERQLTARLASILRWRDTRTGFVGAGLAAAHQRVSGIPGGDPVSKEAPLFMGFKSALKKNQASEDAVTIQGGAFHQGTTMAVSYMTLSLQSWYQDLSYAERVARMFSPQTTPAQAARFTTDAESNPDLLHQAITRYGVIGHSQASARARRNGKPLILRRDFDTVDGAQAGLHFVSLQRTIEDFVTTRKAMNQAGAQLINPAITETVNNGINEFMFVLRRANYIVPSRADRSFPLLPGRAAVV
ncbi:MAG TPA: twin-arginine translocation signal domain-containing protein [Solirubrobacteraceae bacterium]|nr:twin-arginine translocation signal domain-containing protein [Solirubrobacteraceae bacterium]